MDRREFIRRAAGAASLLLLPVYALRTYAAAGIEKITRSNAQWKQLLTPEQYYVLREEGTERPFSSPLDHEQRRGTYACAACGLELFPSQYKYDSGTGWPSFYDVLPGHVETRRDFQLIVPRTE